jgi:hypothetical protein
VFYRVFDKFLYFLLLAYHEVSVFPKKELPFFILFTAGLCSGTATLAFLTHQYPEYTAYFAKTVSLKLFLSRSFNNSLILDNTMVFNTFHLY